MGYFLIGLVWCIVWGVVVSEVIKNKGYQENWFWWGFFFGIFALIVALTKQNVPNSNAHELAESFSKENVVSEMRLNEVTIRQVDVNSAIHILEWKVLKENSGSHIVSIDFFNLSPKTITATLFTATGLNAFDDIILIDGKETFDILQQDMCVEPGRHCNIKAKLPHQDIRKVQLQVKKVCFSDGEVSVDRQSNWIETKQHAIASKYVDLLKKRNPMGAYYAIVTDSYWQCPCGFVNVGHACLMCGMEKLAAREFTAPKIEDTYQEDLNLTILETKAAEIKAAEDAIRAKKQRKKCIIRWISVACIILVCISAGVVISHMKKEKECRIEAAQIEECIKKEKYDDAFAIMISSRSYEKLSSSYGDLLWEKQIELDEAFCPNALEQSMEKYAEYEAERSRGNMCFSYELGKNNSGRYAYVYALCSGEGRSLELLRKQCYSSDGYIFISGLGGTDDEDNYALWSNGWLFLSSTIKYKATYYAIKYDKSQDKAIVVVLPDGVKKATHFYKMKDGNIVMSNGPRVVADTLWIFDVVNGSAREVSHGQYAKIYGNIIEQDKNTLYQKNTKYEGLHFDH